MRHSSFSRWASALALSVAASCVAQDASTTQAYKAACGAVDTKLNADVAQPTTMITPETGKALVYLIQRDDQTNALCLGRKCGGADVRIGMDGAWVGETKGNSFVALSVVPGQHHLCVNWQSHFKKVSHHEAYLQPLSVDSGQTSYFLIHVSAGNGGGDAAVPFSLSLEPVNVDEAKMLLETSPQSTLKK